MKLPAGWTRFFLVQALQLPALFLVIVYGGNLWLPMALWGSCVCCAGTDSLGRWRNRFLICQAITWLVAATVFVSD